jgi:hypothetical protein
MSEYQSETDGMMTVKDPTLVYHQVMVAKRFSALDGNFQHVKGFPPDISPHSSLTDAGIMLSSFSMPQHPNRLSSSSVFQVRCQVHQGNPAFI